MDGWVGKCYSGLNDCSQPSTIGKDNLVDYILQLLGQCQVWTISIKHLFNRVMTKRMKLLISNKLMCFCFFLFVGKIYREEVEHIFSPKPIKALRNILMVFINTFGISYKNSLRQVLGTALGGKSFVFWGLQPLLAHWDMMYFACSKNFRGKYNRQG